VSEDWATKAALHISRSLVLDIPDDGIVEAASIIRAHQLEHERSEASVKTWLQEPDVKEALHRRPALPRS
jgi:hypothetical protein